MGPRATKLSLTLDRTDELPPSMQREVLGPVWPVAGPDAYPRIEHRDRDGVPRPLTERAGQAKHVHRRLARVAAS